MAYKSKIFKICDAIKDILEASDFSDDITVDIKPSGNFEIKNEDGFEIYVYPMNSLYEPDTRTGYSNTQAFGVALSKSLPQVTDTAVDDCVYMLENLIKELCKNKNEFTIGSEKFMPLSVENPDPYDEQIIKKQRQYLSISTVTYRIDVI
jgi:hypothetical protein